MMVLRESGGCQPIYKDADEVVTFKFFHGGKLVKNRKDSQSSYLGGEVSWFDYCEVDYMSMLELFGMAKDLGYDNGSDVVSLTSSQVGNDSSDKEYSCSENDDSSDPEFEDSDYAQ
ncbi:unnamed protein product, partial [Prunus brigantina]